MRQKEEREVLVLPVFRKIKNFAFIFFVLFSFNCFANEDRIKEIEAYLNSIRYITANFIQDDINNSQLTEGMLYLSRPGRLRLDYLNPFEASLYVNNSITVYYDKELDEISNIRTSSTPLSFLLRNKISFNDKSLSVIDFFETDASIEVSLKEKNKESQGTLVLKFTKNPIQISSMRLINELEQEVEIVLFNLDKSPISNSVFEFKNPRLKTGI